MPESQKPEQRPESPAAPHAGDFFTAVIGRVISGILSSEDGATWRIHARRLWIGAAGGVFYTGLKNYFGGSVGVYGLLTMDPTSHRTELMFGYVTAYVASGALGSVAAWLSAQKSGRFLFIIGMLGVQIMTTLFPGLQSRTVEKIGWFFEELRPITLAYAQSLDKCVGDSAFSKGFKAAFGVRDQYNQYIVVVASGKTPDDAQAKLKAINAQDSSIKLRVGPRACDNDYYPVYAGDYLPLNEAKVALDKIRKSTGVTDAYLSPGPLY
jgi:hypothetical protein